MLDSFEVDAAKGIDRSMVLNLARGDWPKREANLLLVGPIGPGKRHLDRTGSRGGKAAKVSGVLAGRRPGSHAG